jgi:hypothetical protein
VPEHEQLRGRDDGHLAALPHEIKGRNAAVKHCRSKPEPLDEQFE